MMLMCKMSESYDALNPGIDSHNSFYLLMCAYFDVYRVALKPVLISNPQGDNVWISNSLTITRANITPLLKA